MMRGTASGVIYSVWTLSIVFSGLSDEKISMKTVTEKWPMTEDPFAWQSEWIPPGIGWVFEVLSAFHSTNPA